MGETATGTVERTVDPGGVVDTDILVDALRRVPVAVTFLRDVERYLTVAAITQMELLQPDGPRSNGGAPLLKPSTAGRFWLASLQSFSLFLGSSSC